MRCPQFDPLELENLLEQRSRRPFRSLLARILQNSPSDEAIHALAEKNPDRFGQLLALVGRLGGFTEKLELEGSIDLKIQGLSDSELEARVLEMKRQLDMPSSDRMDK